MEKHIIASIIGGILGYLYYKKIGCSTGISVRTIHYYDEIGLLKPSEITKSGYRLYDDESLKTLQHILFIIKYITKICNR